MTHTYESLAVTNTVIMGVKGMYYRILVLIQNENKVRYFITFRRGTKVE